MTDDGRMYYDAMGNRLYVIEIMFKNQKELLQDIENFKSAQYLVFTEISTIYLVTADRR